MFLPFFQTLREEGVPVSLREFLAFLEGMALFSIILDPDKDEFQKILAGFQAKIIEML